MDGHCRTKLVRTTSLVSTYRVWSVANTKCPVEGLGMVEIASYVPLSQLHPKTNHKHNIRGRAKFGSLYGESRAEYIVKRWKYQ